MEWMHFYFILSKKRVLNDFLRNDVIAHLCFLQHEACACIDLQINVLLGDGP